MEIYWEKTDITQYCQVAECVYHERADGESDTLEIKFGKAASWHRWAPEMDDRVRVKSDGVDTGSLFLNTIIAEGNYYRIIATSLRAKACRKTWTSYKALTFQKLLEVSAAEAGMEARIHGRSDIITYPYIEREGESAAGFMARVCRMEGMRLKCSAGKMQAIDISYAQSRDPMTRITMNAEDLSRTWERRLNAKWSAVNIRTPEARGRASDTDAAGAPEEYIGGLACADNGAAKRWAAGILLDHNRKAEKIRIEGDLNARMTVMERVDIEGGTEADGEWIVDEAEHDLKNKKSRITLARVIKTIQ